MRAFAPQVALTVASDVENKDNSVFEGLDDIGDTLSGWWILGRMIAASLGLAKPFKFPFRGDIALKVA
jgi:hypothetical protein